MPEPPPAPPLAAAVEPYSQDAQPTGMEMDDSFEPTQVVEDLDPYPVQEQESRIMEVERGQDLASQASNTQGPEATDLENEETILAQPSSTANSFSTTWGFFLNTHNPRPQRERNATRSYVRGSL